MRSHGVLAPSVAVSHGRARADLHNLSLVSTHEYPHKCHHYWSFHYADYIEHKISFIKISLKIYSRLLHFIVYKTLITSIQLVVERFQIIEYLVFKSNFRLHFTPTIFLICIRLYFEHTANTLYSIMVP